MVVPNSNFWTIEEKIISKILINYVIEKCKENNVDLDGFDDDEFTDVIIWKYLQEFCNENNLSDECRYIILGFCDKIDYDIYEKL